MEHFGISSFGVLQKDLSGRRIIPEFAQCLYAVENSLARILVNLHSHELGLTNSNDGRHDQHRLSVNVKKSVRMKASRLRTSARNEFDVVLSCDC